MTYFRHPPLCALLLLASLLPASAWAHEGHAHEDTDTPAAVAPAAPQPRLTHASPQLEAVALVDGNALLIYADDFATNQPLAGLDVGVRSGGRLIKAQESEAGLYRVPRDLLPAGDALVLDIAVQARDWSEHFAGTLAVGPEHPHHAEHGGHRLAWPLAGGGAVILVAAAWRLRRRRRA